MGDSDVATASPCEGQAQTAPSTRSSNAPSDVSPLYADNERWEIAEKRIQQLIEKIQPTKRAEERRIAVSDYVQRLIRKCIDCEVFMFGSVPLKTYLPDGDIDLTAFSRHINLKDTWANEVKAVLEEEEHNCDAEFRVREVQYIQAEVKIIKCLVENIVVDVSFNQLGGLCTLCFLEEVDRLIGKNHLFKRSIILVKAWCYYESRILGAHHGLISTYGLETLVLYIFHVFHASLKGPLQVLLKFLNFFSTFDWDKYCVSLRGPVLLTSLPNITVEPPQPDGGELLLQESFLAECSATYSLAKGLPDNKERQFAPKFMNVIDPLLDSNNLGRSVSKGNFFRIRSAFSYAARKLSGIMKGHEENMQSELDSFFKNTWERNGHGMRPDAPPELVPRALPSQLPNHITRMPSNGRIGPGGYNLQASRGNKGGERREDGSEEGHGQMWGNGGLSYPERHMMPFGGPPGATWHNMPALSRSALDLTAMGWTPDMAARLVLEAVQQGYDPALWAQVRAQMASQEQNDVGLRPGVPGAAISQGAWREERGNSAESLSGDRNGNDGSLQSRVNTSRHASHSSNRSQGGGELANSGCQVIGEGTECSAASAEDGHRPGADLDRHGVAKAGRTGDASHSGASQQREERSDNRLTKVQGFEARQRIKEGGAISSNTFGEERVPSGRSSQVHEDSGMRSGKGPSQVWTKKQMSGQKAAQSEGDGQDGEARNEDKIAVAAPIAVTAWSKPSQSEVHRSGLVAEEASQDGGREGTSYRGFTSDGAEGHAAPDDNTAQDLSDNQGRTAEPGNISSQYPAAVVGRAGLPRDAGLDSRTTEAEIQPELSAAQVPLGGEPVVKPLMPPQVHLPARKDGYSVKSVSSLPDGLPPVQFLYNAPVVTVGDDVSSGGMRQSAGTGPFLQMAFEKVPSSVKYGSRPVPLQGLVPPGTSSSSKQHLVGSEISEDEVASSPKGEQQVIQQMQFPQLQQYRVRQSQSQRQQSHQQLHQQLQHQYQRQQQQQAQQQFSHFSDHIFAEDHAQKHRILGFSGDNNAGRLPGGRNGPLGKPAVVSYVPPPLRLHIPDQGTFPMLAQSPTAMQVLAQPGQPIPQGGMLLGTLPNGTWVQQPGTGQVIADVDFDKLLPLPNEISAFASELGPRRISSKAQVQEGAELDSLGSTEARIPRALGQEGGREGSESSGESAKESGLEIDAPEEDEAGGRPRDATSSNGTVSKSIHKSDLVEGLLARRLERGRPDELAANPIQGSNLHLAVDRKSKYPQLMPSPLSVSVPTLPVHPPNFPSATGMSSPRMMPMPVPGQRPRTEVSGLSAMSTSLPAGLTPGHPQPPSLPRPMMTPSHSHSPPSYMIVSPHTGSPPTHNLHMPGLSGQGLPMRPGSLPNGDLGMHMGGGLGQRPIGVPGLPPGALTSGSFPPSTGQFPFMAMYGTHYPFSHAPYPYYFGRSPEEADGLSARLDARGGTGGMDGGADRHMGINVEEMRGQRPSAHASLRPDGGPSMVPVLPLSMGGRLPNQGGMGTSVGLSVSKERGTSGDIGSPLSSPRGERDLLSGDFEMHLHNLDFGKRCQSAKMGGSGGGTAQGNSSGSFSASNPASGHRPREGSGRGSTWHGMSGSNTSIGPSPLGMKLGPGPVPSSSSGPNQAARMSSGPSQKERFSRSASLSSNGGMPSVNGSMYGEDMGWNSRGGSAGGYGGAGVHPGSSAAFGYMGGTFSNTANGFSTAGPYMPNGGMQRQGPGHGHQQQQQQQPIYGHERQGGRRGGGQQGGYRQDRDRNDASWQNGHRSQMGRSQSMKYERTSQMNGGPDHMMSRPLDKGMERGMDRGLERGYDKGSDRPGPVERGSDKAGDRVSDKVERDLDRGADRGMKGDRNMDKGHWGRVGEKGIERPEGTRSNGAHHSNAQSGDGRGEKWEDNRPEKGAHIRAEQSEVAPRNEGPERGKKKGEDLVAEEGAEGRTDSEAGGGSLVQPAAQGEHRKIDRPSATPGVVPGVATTADFGLPAGARIGPAQPGLGPVEPNAIAPADASWASSPGITPALVPGHTPLHGEFMPGIVAVPSGIAGRPRPGGPPVEPPESGLPSGTAVVMSSGMDISQPVTLPMESAEEGGQREPQREGYREGVQREGYREREDGFREARRSRPSGRREERLQGGVKLEELASKGRGALAVVPGERPPAGGLVAAPGNAFLKQPPAAGEPPRAHLQYQLKEEDFPPLTQGERR